MKLTNYLFLLFAFVSIQLGAQVLYSGHLSDLGTRGDLANVAIRSSTDKTVHSNEFGDFALLVSKEETPVGLYAQQNHLIWEGIELAAIRIYSIAGKLLFQDPLNNELQQYILPRLQPGIAVAVIEGESTTTKLKLFSNGQQTFFGDKNAAPLITNPTIEQDTLTFSKNGYYERQLIVPASDTSFNFFLQAKEYEDLDYFNELIDFNSFERLSSEPSRTNNGEVLSVKIISNIDNGLLYYMNTKKHELHYFFARDILNYSAGPSIFNDTQYQENDNRYFYPGNLNYYEALDKYVLHLVGANEMYCESIRALYNHLIQTSYLKGKLFFFANKPEWELCDDIPSISSEELYEGQNYQALNLAENYGYLRTIDIDDVEEEYLGRRDLVVLNGIPNDLPVVAGIITTEFQTPLSHINILSHNRGTPNMALRDALTNPRIDSLMGKLVYLKVESSDFTIRTATLAEAENFWELNEPTEVIVLDKITTDVGLIDLEEADISWVNRIGGKASNYGELLNVNNPLNPISSPENPFAIPFSYYENHMSNSGLQSQLVSLLEDAEFQANPIVRQASLAALRESIIDYPIDPNLIALVEEEINNFSDFSSYRFRSSTNAEDLDFFSGAGLYGSHSALKGHSNKTIEQAIKEVWASLWNWRAFEERSYYKIDHLSCAMAVLSHRSFPYEEANGVIVTENLYNSNHGFIINTQFDNNSIVFPEPGVIHDQIMLLAWSISDDEDFTIEYLSYSNLPEYSGTVLSDSELYQLGDLILQIKIHWYNNVPHNCECSFKEFGLDIEFKIDSSVEDRQIYIKQVRPFD